MAQEVQHWGIHWAPDDVAWLLQARGGMPAFFMKGVDCPFFVRKTPTRICNHLMAPNNPNPAREHQEMFRRLVEEDEVVRLMLPLPKDAVVDANKGVALLRTDMPDDMQTRLVNLSRMSSPIRTPILWMGLTQPREILRQLEQTNVQPLVLMGVKPEHANGLLDVARQATHLPRRLLLVADPMTPWRGAEIVSKALTKVNLNDLTALPWESLGGMVLKGYMRREWTGSWFTRDPTPANEYRRPLPTR